MKEVIVFARDAINQGVWHHDEAMEWLRIYYVRNVK